MPLTLLLGPANCGKVAQLFDRFAEQVDAGAAPTLVVPTRPDVELAERDLLARRSAVLGGMIGTFEDLFERVLERCGEPSAALARLPRRLVLEQVVREAGLDQLAVPSRFAGFVDGLGRMFDDLAGSAPPELLERRLAAFSEPGRRLELAVLHGAFRARLAGPVSDPVDGVLARESGRGARDHEDRARVPRVDHLFPEDDRIGTRKSTARGANPTAKFAVRTPRLSCSAWPRGTYAPKIN